MSAKPRLTVRGLAPGESPSVLVEIPLDGKHAELAEHVLERLVGAGYPLSGATLPLSTTQQTGGAAGFAVAPLTTRGHGDGDDH